MKKRELNPEQELFCKLFATTKEFFGNGTQAYIEAYDIDIKHKGAYASARTCASNLLTNLNILDRINELLELGGLSNERVDKELLFLITQDAEFSAKLGAIKEYNQLKNRIQKKLEIGLENIEGITVEIINPREENEDAPELKTN